MYTIFQGNSFDVLQTMSTQSCQCVVTSPPYYGLRDYGVEKQIGLEQSPQDYVNKLIEVFTEIWRVLRDDGTLWLNLGDSYLRNSLIGIPWMVAFALRDRGWYLRSDIIWAKPNPMTESVKNRPTKSHEYIFLFSKLPSKYYYDHEAILEPANPKYLKRYNYAFNTGKKEKQNGRPGGASNTAGKKNPKMIGQTEVSHSGYINSDGSIRATLRDGMPMRNKRSVWTVNTKPFKEAHFATFPVDLIEPCILAGSRPGDMVLDPFAGSGTTGYVALTHHRKFTGIEINPSYVDIIHKRLEEWNEC